MLCEAAAVVLEESNNTETTEANSTNKSNFNRSSNSSSDCGSDMLKTSSSKSKSSSKKCRLINLIDFRVFDFRIDLTLSLENLRYLFFDVFFVFVSSTFDRKRGETMEKDSRLLHEKHRIQVR